MAANNANSLDDQGRLLRSEFTNNFLLMSDVKGLRREVNSTTRKLSVVAVGNGSGADISHELKEQLRAIYSELKNQQLKPSLN